VGSLEDRVLTGGLLPDRLLRRVIRARVRDLAESFDGMSPRAQSDREAALMTVFEAGPIAVNTDDANRQHYDLPTEFFSSVLGPRLKYSCCYWPDATAGLAEAEEAMLELTADRAQLGDGQTILDLGCGWGSLALWAAERYPGSRVVALPRLGSTSQTSASTGWCRSRCSSTCATTGCSCNE
jgi:cyclopropane-fatty-acyl-phospholipid synthase